MDFLKLIKAGIALYRAKDPLPDWTDPAAVLVFLNRIAPAEAALIAASAGMFDREAAGVYRAAEGVTVAAIQEASIACFDAGELSDDEALVVGKINWAALLEFIKAILPLILPLFLDAKQNR